MADSAPPPITAAQIAWCGDVSSGRRHSWASKGRLKLHPPFTTHDAVETALAFRLADSQVSQKIATKAWEVVRAEVKQLIVAGEREIWFVVAAQGPRHRAVAGADAAARVAEQLGQCWLVSSGEAAAEARKRFDELSADSGRSASVQPIRAKRGA